MIALHADVVGSLLRPAELLVGQKQLAAGTLSYEQFKEIEDRAIDDAIALQENAGLEIVSDGEMRRQSFQSQMTAAVDGFGAFGLDAFLWGDWYDSLGVHRHPRPDKLGVVEKLSRRRYLSADEFPTLRRRPGEFRRLPSPAQHCGSIFGRQNIRERRILRSMRFSPTLSASCARKLPNSCASAGLTSKSTRHIMACCSIPERGFSTKILAGVLNGGSLWASSWTTRWWTDFAM